MIVFHCCALLLAAVSLWLEGTSYLNGTCTHIRAYEFKFFQGPVGERRLLSTQTATSGRGRAAKQLLQNLNYMWKGAVTGEIIIGTWRLNCVSSGTHYPARLPPPMPSIYFSFRMVVYVTSTLSHFHCSYFIC